MFLQAMQDLTAIVIKVEWAIKEVTVIMVQMEVASIWVEAVIKEVALAEGGVEKDLIDCIYAPY